MSEYKPWTEEELQAAIAHDIAILEEHWKDMPPEPDENAALDALEDRVEARIQSVRVEFMRWTLLAFMAAVAICVTLVKL